ncbi:AsnC family transcriptional regulator [Aureimonas sp. SA4125]|uniref:GntR family transcriptional regulator n=1 Tax=Aureimonas sp. SA4125 TaxID=2826993 RepID=UPI001CC5A040|nr:GntR family transcriptional regulator [Aureimonas sp. SA4125]BDA85250.1 AsnC family transcriptional regulator [Aureimonas sp. SA4125]
MIPALRVRGSGAQFVYDSLRRDILDLSLPPGSPLDEAGLSERFDMSRTPVREALMRLAADGLTATLPNRSTIVAPIDFATLPAYFEALTLMYRVTTRSAARRCRDGLDTVRAHQSAFAEAVEARDVLAMIEANRDFHVAIAHLGGNPYFTILFTRLLDEGRRILRLYYASFDDRLPHRYVEEHEAMIAAIEAGDADTADQLASAHAAQIVRQIQDYIAGSAADPLDLSRTGC